MSNFIDKNIFTDELRKFMKYLDTRDLPPADVMCLLEVSKRMINIGLTAEYVELIGDKNEY